MSQVIAGNQKANAWSFNHVVCGCEIRMTDRNAFVPGTNANSFRLVPVQLATLITSSVSDACAARMYCGLGRGRLNLGLGSNQAGWLRDGMRSGGGRTRDFAGCP